MTVWEEIVLEDLEKRRKRCLEKERAPHQHGSRSVYIGVIKQIRNSFSWWFIGTVLSGIHFKVVFFFILELLFIIHKYAVKILQKQPSVTVNGDLGETHGERDFIYHVWYKMEWREKFSKNHEKLWKVIKSKLSAEYNGRSQENINQNLSLCNTGRKVVTGTSTNSKHSVFVTTSKREWPCKVGRFKIFVIRLIILHLLTHI